jgi:mannosyltransferase OCH1-like enzyme
MKPINPSNNIIQSLWIGDKLSPMELLCVQSFIQHGHKFHLYTYENIQNVPDKVDQMDANSIISEDRIFFDSHGGVSAFSDWFRYQLLYIKGGWWVDMDTVCLKFFDFNSDFCFSTEKPHPPHKEALITTGFLKSPPNAEFLADILEYIESIDHSDVVWGEMGPRLLRAVLKHYESEIFAEPPETFCPLNWDEVNKLTTANEELTDFSESYAIHLWNETWRVNHLDKYAKYHPESLYEKLKSRYGIS